MAVDDVINEDPDLFEITDFTTSTDWERFVASVEAVIHEWKLTSIKSTGPLKEGELSNGVWETVSEDVKFASFAFRITRHYLSSSVKHDDDVPFEDDPPPFAQDDMITPGNDFPPRAHYLVRWYGIRDFLVVSPNPEDQTIATEDRARLLLSSLCLALSNSRCPLPAFVQVHHPQERLCFGTCIGGGFATYYDMVHLVHVPPPCSNLSGLLSLFKSKMSYSSQLALPPVDVTIRFTYIINEWSPYEWPQLPPDIIDEASNSESLDMGKIPFGALEYPIAEMQLSVTWPSVPEDVVVDSDVHSDLRPTSAPKWSVRMRWTDSPRCLMEEYLQNFSQLCDSRSSLSAILKGISNSELTAQPEIVDVLDRLSQPGTLPAAFRASQHPTSERYEEGQHGVLGNVLLVKMLGYIFLSSDYSPLEQKILFADSLDVESPSENINTTTRLLELKENLCTMKTAQPGSFVWRLALAASSIYHNYGGLEALSQFWVKFVSEVRHYWDNNYILPSLEAGPPNLATCLLHQKLQMLNCCIESKRKWEYRHTQQVESSTQAKPGSSESDDDEFYECPDAFSSAEAKVDASIEDESSGKDPTAPTREGVLRKCGTLTLLETCRPMYIPVTQEPVPMTEDMLEEHAEALVQLGSNPEGAALRARMQSACLLSDMEAFKAANPAATLGDFVRWYSPRDWIAAVTDEATGEVLQEGHLSPRMQLPGNTWQEVWDTARPVPAHRQKRLFDDTKEAEKVLHYLISMSPAAIAKQLMPVLVHCALSQIIDDAYKGPRSLTGFLEQTVAKVSTHLRAKAPKYKEVLRLLHEAEVSIVRGESLRQKLEHAQNDEDGSCATGDSNAKQQSSSVIHRQAPGQDPRTELENFVLDLLDKPEVDVPGAGKGHAGKMIARLFVDSQKVTDPSSEADPLLEHKFPSPVGREYILRTRYARPTPASRPTPQRLYCVMAGNDFRLAGAFSKDLVFY